MPASTDKRLRLAALLLAMAGAVSAQSGGPLLDAVDSSDGERHVNVFAQLRCSARFLGQQPQDHGTSVTIRLRLGADCGLGDSVRPSERAPGGGSAIVRTVRLEQSFPGEVALTIEWSGEHSFVVTPTADAHGIRLRILDVFPGPRGAVTVKPLDEPTSGYAINVDSSTTPYTLSAIDEASAILKTPLHVSTVELAGETWYRLRAGPISSRGDAQRLLAVARQHFPRAWMGVADEPAAAEGVLPPSTELSPTVTTDPALPEEQLDALMAEARKAVARKDLPRAIELLTKLTRQPEFPERARAQEMLGLARERSGQLAHAKAEYEEYLRRYPRGESATRIRARLRTLNGAHRVARNGMLVGVGEDEEQSWRFDGGASQLYRWERSELTTVQADAQQQDQNALYTDVDLIARRRGERYDFVSRFAGGFAYDMLPDGPGNQSRISSAFVELNDRDLGVAARLGRQSRNSGGLLGTFDGLFGSYQLRPRIALNAAVGFPVESTRDGIQSDRRFFGLSADFGPFDDKLDLGTYIVVQQMAGEPDRQAVGVEGRYFVPGRTILAMVDYDVHYQELNSAVVTGSIQLPARWILSFSGDHRRSPVLTTRNALIGQPVETMEDLLDMYSPDEVEQLARDRTPLTDLFSLSVSRPLGERFQVSFDAYANRFGETVASGNVAATPASDLETTLQLQLMANNLALANDLWVLAGRYQNGSQVKIESLALAARVPVGGAWRLGPRIRVDRRDSVVDAADETLYVPTLRLDFERGRTWLEFEAGAEFGQRQLGADDESSRRYYFGLGYRLSF